MYYIKPAKGYITSLFSNSRKNPVLGIIRPHQGCDIGSDADNTIVAAASGKVRVADNPGKTGFGNYVVITHPNGQETVYAHLSAVSVRVGQSVKQGQKIGVKGTTGNSTGVHLHFEISKRRWTNSFSNKIDPLTQFVDPVTKELQEKLNKLGYGPLIVDGLYGEGTISAVGRFQQARKLVSDGVAGRATHSLMDKLVADVTTAIKPKPQPPKENDEMAQLLPNTQKADMAKLLKKAYEEKVFSVDHSEKVGTMTRGEAVDLLISYTARTVAKKG